VEFYSKSREEIFRMATMKTIDIAFRDLRNNETWDSEKMRSSRKFKSTLVAPADVSALATARIADANGIRFIMIQGEEGGLAGFILPIWTRRQIGTMLGNRNFTTLTEALEAYEVDPKARKRNFHSEMLNKDRPAMSWCSAGHAVDGCPCDIDEHKNLGCSAEPV
jgi:hypothetical protein